MPGKSSTRRRKKGRKRVKSGNNIRLKIKNLAKLKNKVKTRKYKRIQYGCKNMKGGNATVPINIGGSISDFFNKQTNTLGGYTDNTFGGLTQYPKS